MEMILEITDKEYKQFCELVYDSVGINLKKGKRELLKTRLAKRLRALGLQSFGQYYKHVIKDDPSELTNLFDAISTNKTSFFREMHHFDFLTDSVLPGIVEEKRKSRNKEIRVWSAACSAGQEPYSIAITVSRFLGNELGWNIKVLGTDISTKVLAKAERGVYSECEVEGLPKDIYREYFLKGKGGEEGSLRVKKSIRDHIFIRRLNLISESFPFKKKFDFIFCRNVMIYFDKATQSALISRIESYLAPGGYLFLGHAESLTALNTDFEFVRPTVYRKPF